MEKLSLLALGTPLIDSFANVDFSFLSKFRLRLGSTNMLTDEELIKIEQEFEGKVVFQYPGDNARNVCEAFMSVEKGQRMANAMAGNISKSNPAQANFSPKRAAYAGVISNDKAGKLIVANIEKLGIENYLQTAAEGNTGRIMCLITPDKQRTFAVYLGVGNNQADIEPLPIAQYYYCTSITFLCGEPIAYSAEDYLKRAKKNSSAAAISFESPKMLEEKRKEALKLAQMADILFLNEDEMRAVGLSESEVGSICKKVFLKKGAKGSSVFVDGKKLGDVPALVVANVVDTTGAGDAYCAGVLWALSNGKTELEAAQKGGELASKVIQKMGSGL